MATALAPLLARLAHAPLALCPARGPVALRAVTAMFDGGNYEGLDRRPPPPAGVIPIHGVLVRRGTGDAVLDDILGIVAYETIQDRLGAALANRGVDVVVLDIDSPGGEVQGLLDAADMVRAARRVKPIVARANENALSAAYVIAAAAGAVEVARTGMVGSVGVVAMHRDLSGFLAEAGIKCTFIHAGAKKVDGNPYEPLSERARAELQASVDRAYELLVAHVAESRGMTPEAVRATEAGVFEGDDALKVGFADAITSQANRGGSAARSMFGARPPFPTRRTA